MLESPARDDQIARSDPHLPGDGEQVRLVRLEKSEEGREQPGLAGALSQFGRDQAGQGQKAVGQAFFLQSRAKRAERKQLGLVCLIGLHGLIFASWRSLGDGLAKILIVEDNALNIKLFCDLLAAHGHEPQAVTDSRMALDAARHLEPDLVITDIQLPHVSGMELIREIRADERLREVPIMAVTAYSAIGDEERIRDAGAQAYVSKPISVVRFVEQVSELLEGGKAVEAAGASPDRGRG